MNIAVSSNIKFYRYLYVMLVSLFENNRDTEICVYIMSADFREQEVNGLQELCELYGQRMVFLKITTDMFPSGLPVNEIITIETYFRLALAYILPDDIDRVLYLDVDIIINKPINGLYDTDFNGRMFVACRDVTYVAGKYVQESELFGELRDKAEFKYINAGVLLINLRKMRENVSFVKMMNVALEKKEGLKFHDQDLINYMFFDDILYADEEKYNLISRPAYNSGFTYENVLEKTAIIHYAGPKPWSCSDVHYIIEIFWWNYAKLTPFYTELLEDYVIGQVRSGCMDSLFRSLKSENDELHKIVDKCMELLKRNI